MDGPIKPLERGLEGKLVVVAGATGNVGEGVTRAFLRSGARVIAPSRGRVRLDSLRGLLGGEATENLVGVVGDTGSFDGFRAVAERIEGEHGPVDHVVAALGTWWQGKPVWDVTEEEFDLAFAQNVRPHFAAARALVPVMREGGSYTFVAGLSALVPIPGASLTGMQGGTQLMLGSELQADVGERLRVNSVVLGYVISRARPRGRPDWLSADDVGDLVVRVAASDVRGQTIRADDKPAVQRSLEPLGL